MGFLTVLTAPHGGAERGLILSVVERVAISVHGMVEKREVPNREGLGSEGLGWAHPFSFQLKSRRATFTGPTLFWDNE